MAFKISKNGVLKEYTEEPGVTYIVIPNSVECIADYVFRDCKGIQNVIIPESVTKIGDSVFEGCENLISLSIPDTLTNIGWRAFHGCKGLIDSKGFVIVNGVLFGYFGEDEVVEIPYGTTRIAEFAFEDCGHVTKITIPDSVTIISPRAFDSIKGNPVNIRDIFIPESVIEIGELAFSGGKNLRIIIDGKNTKLRCLDGMTDVYANRIYILNRMSLTKLWKEEQELSILAFAEDYCIGADIPSFRKNNYISFLSRSRKDYYALAAKELKLLQLLISERIIKKDEIDSVLELIQKDGFYEIISLMMEYKDSFESKKKEENKQRKEAEIDSFNAGIITPGEAKKVWTYTKKEDGTIILKGYKGKDKDIRVPEYIGGVSVTEIGEGCFSPFANRVPEWLFSVRYGIQRIFIPENVKYIGKQAFDGCYRLEKLQLPNELMNEEFFGISGCDNLNEIIVPNGIKKIGSYSFWGCEKLQSVEIAKSVVDISQYAFYDCKNLSKIIIPETVCEIHRYAWYKCDNVVIKICQGSAAEKYAKENGIPFQYL